MSKLILVLTVLFTIAGCASPGMDSSGYNKMQDPYAKQLQTPIP
jgi:hypothetical protein